MTIPRRCEWCGAFVRHDQPLTAWRVQVGPGHRQDPDSPWNYWARLLCPDHGAAIHVPPIWERTTVDEVLRQRCTLRAPVSR
jgi:hypothetical protein